MWGLGQAKVRVSTFSGTVGNNSLLGNFAMDSVLRCKPEGLSHLLCPEEAVWPSKLDCPASLVLSLVLNHL